MEKARVETLLRAEEERAGRLLQGCGYDVGMSRFCLTTLM
jgi:hypothetical protein